MTKKPKKFLPNIRLTTLKKIDPIILFLLLGTFISWIVHSRAYHSINGCAGYNGSQRLFLYALIFTGALFGYVAAKPIYNNSASKAKGPTDYDLSGLGALAVFLLVGGVTVFLLYAYLGFMLYYCF